MICSIVTEFTNDPRESQIGLQVPVCGTLSNWFVKIRV